MLFDRKVKSTFDTDVPKIIVGSNEGSGAYYDRLKDNVIYYSDNGKNKVFQIESSVSGEGKSTVAINLSVALARSGKKVCLLDLDFRRPKIHRSFNIPNQAGISEYMLGECTKEELIKTTEYGVDVVNRGKAAQNTAIIFTSDKFKELISELREKYDIIILDCPPVLLVSDYIHISKFSDAVLFIVLSGVTHRAQLKDSIELLNRNNVNIFGIAMTYKNTAKFKRNGYYSGGYYKNSSYKYSEEN